MRFRFAVLALSFTALSLVALLRAQDFTKDKSADNAQSVKEELATREQQLSRQFAEFESQLLRLAQRLEKSTKEEDRSRAKILRQILEESKRESIAVQFERLTAFMRESKFKNVSELKDLTDRSEDLSNKLRRLIDMFRDDPRQKQANEERKFLEKLVKEVQKVITQERQLQGLTEVGRTDPKELKDNQGHVKKKTEAIANSIDKYLKGNGAEPKEPNDKAGPKDAGKEGGEKATAKDEGAKPPETAQAEAKAPGKESQGAKGDPKPGSEAPKAEAKSGKAGEGKPSAAAAKESKGSEGSPSEAKSGSPKQGKPSQGQAKAGDKKDGQSQAKDDGQKRDPQDMNPQGAETAQKGDGEKKDGPPSSPNANAAPKPNEDLSASRKKIAEAGYDMAKAEDNLEKKKMPEAVKNEGDSIKKLEEVKEKLEKLLRQKREEEMERLLAALQARCEKMLAMQMQVLAGTEQLFRVIEMNEEKKPSRLNQGDSIKLSDSEKDIVTEATKAIMMLEEEGSAVAFPEVFQQVREDMKHVQRRLEVTDVGEGTQTIEKDIIASLKEMIDALKKARQELDQQKNPGPPKESGPPPDPKLLDQIAELKMIRSLQKRVNDRTQMYGKLYPGEQAAEKHLRQEIQGLAERQERIFDITNRIAKGDNR